MKRMFVWMAAAASLLTMSANVYASIIAVPEIDAGGAAIALALMAGIVALIRERR
jgi:hypothetical protein